MFNLFDFGLSASSSSSWYVKRCPVTVGTVALCARNDELPIKLYSPKDFNLRRKLSISSGLFDDPRCSVIIPFERMFTAFLDDSIAVRSVDLLGHLKYAVHWFHAREELSTS